MTFVQFEPKVQDIIHGGVYERSYMKNQLYRWSPLVTQPVIC
jgi:hypothetical protein